jgi:hypothetical protein
MSNGNEAMSNVPEDKVGEIAQQFIDLDNATYVRCEKTADGTWTIIAH